ASLHCVDYVAINEWPAAIETIKLLRPDFYVKGSDYRDFSKDVTGGIILEDEAIRSVGGELVFTDELSSSSSHLINKYLSQLSREAQEFLEQFSLRHDLSEVLSYLERAAELKVLVLGETIIDQYFYCETLGKSGKEPILAVRLHSGEKFAGGVLAVANHLAQ